jgi:hypothetical protein
MYGCKALLVSLWRNELFWNASICQKSEMHILSQEDNFSQKDWKVELAASSFLGSGRWNQLLQASTCLSRSDRRREVISIDQVGVMLGSFAVLGIVVDGLLRKVPQKAQKFPYCRTCGKSMVATGISKFVPGEVSNFLDKYGLPTIAASRFICPNGHYQLWFVPKFGNTEKAFFMKEEL